MAEGALRVFVDSAWWKDLDKFVGAAVEAQCEALQYTVLRPAAAGADLKEALVKANVVVLDLYRNGARVPDVLAALSSVQEREGGAACVVGVSTFLTWGRTRGAGALSESKFTRRGCAPKYKQVKQLETLLINAARPGVVESVVVAPGVLYGGGEDDAGFRSFFQDAWLCGPVRFLGDGKVIPPTFNVADLARLVFQIKSEAPPKPYVVAVDESKDTLRAIAEAVSKALGTGAVESVSTDLGAKIDANVLIGAYGDRDVASFDKTFEPGYVASVADKLEWASRSGPVAALSALVEQFKSSNDLRPLKIALYGRPGAGKTFWAQRLAKAYYLPVVNVAKLVAAAEDVDEKNSAAVTALVKKTLRSAECRNKGFILDGYPGSFAEAEALCKLTEDEVKARQAPAEAPAEGGEEGGEEAAAPAPADDSDAGCTPAFLIDLAVSREEAEERVREIPEDQIVQGQNDEATFKSRSDKFDADNKEGADPPTSALDYFRGSIDPLEVGYFAQNNEKSAIKLMKAYIEKGGKPQNFRPTKVESIAARKAREAKAAEADAKAKAAQQEKESKERERREAMERKDVERKRQVLLEEQALVENCSKPLRAYLMSNVIPPLVQGLLAVCKAQPDDPIDYLSEFLFKCAASKKDAAPAADAKQAPAAAESAEKAADEKKAAADA